LVIAALFIIVFTLSSFEQTESFNQDKKYDNLNIEEDIEQAGPKLLENPESDRFTSLESVLVSPASQKNIEDHIDALTFKGKNYQGSRVTGYGEGLNQATTDPENMNDYYDVVAYINETFDALPGMDVIFHEFPVTIAIDKGSWLGVYDSQNVLVSNITVYALESNGVNPSTSDLRNRQMYYVKEGLASSYPSENVKSSIIAMDMDSEARWKIAMSFGAEAIVFIEPDTNMSKGILDDKSTGAPLNIPRVMIKQNDWLSLQPLMDSHSFSLKVNMQWEQKMGINVLGVLNVTKNIEPSETDAIKESKEGLLISSHFDTWSTVPSLAPGASDVGGIATLLELARIYAVKATQDQVKRNLFFLALSGHYQSLTGSRSFVEDYIFANDDSISSDQGTRHPLAEQMWFGINLDLSGDYHIASPFAYGYYYSQFLPYLTAAVRNSADMVRQRWSDFIGNWTTFTSDGITAESYALLSDRLLSSDRGTMAIDHFEEYMSNYFWLDSEPFYVSGTTSVTLKTIFSADLYRDSPSNIPLAYGGMSGFMTNLIPQVVIVNYLIDQTIEHFFYEEGKIHQHLVHSALRQGASWAEFSKIYGRVVLYPQTEQDTVNVNSTWVKTEISVSEGRHFERSVLSGTDGNFLVQVVHQSGVTWGVNEIIMADDATGFFDITGLHNNNMGGLASGGSYSISVFYVTKTGQILYVTDYGDFGTPSSITINQAVLGDPRLKSAHRQPGQERIDYAVFECASLSVYNLLNSRNLLDPQSELTVNRQADRLSFTQSFNFDGIEVGTGAYAQQYYASFDAYGNAMLFTKENKPIRLRVFVGGGHPVAVLTNSSETNVDGYGYQSKSGVTINIEHPMFQSAKDFWLITNKRLTQMREFNVFSPTADAAHSRATELIAVAEEALSIFDYDTFYSASINAYSLEREAYSATRSTMLSVIQSTIFFFILLLPFSFIFERMVFNFSGPKRIATLVGIFLAFNLLIYFFQPGYHLASNVIMVGIGFIMIVLSVPVVIILANDAYTYLQEFRRKVVGEHFAEFGKVEAGIVSFGVAVSNLRKRRFSTALTITSITLITFSLVSFVSVSSAAELQAAPIDGDYIGYNGMLIQRIGDGRQKLSVDLVDYVTERLTADFDNITITSRIWSDPLQGSNWYILSEYEGTFSEADVGAFLGLQPQENEFLDYKSILIGDWFDQSSYREVILPLNIAQSLISGNVSKLLGQNIHIRGVDLEVVGLLNTSHKIEPMNKTFDQLARTLDQEDITPISDKGNHFSLSDTALIPFKLAADNPWGSYKKGIYLSLAQIAVKFNQVLDWDTLQSKAVELRKSLPLLDIYIGLQVPEDENPYAGQFAEYRKGQSFQLIGIETLIIPVIIAVSVVAGTVLSAVQQQLREISVYNALGLSPENIGWMYLAQSLVYGLMGGVLGYSFGMVVLAILEALSLLPASFVPNYTGLAVIMAIGLSIASVIIASIYPIRQAVLFSLPSHQRKWEIPTKPELDIWNIPFPFSTASVDEALGVLHYLFEFFESHRTEGIGSFAVLESVIDATDKEKIQFKGKMRLAPWNWGLLQDYNFNTFYSSEEEKFLFELGVTRISGDRAKWEKVNGRKFFRDVRKQLLLWRGLSLDKRESHIEEGKNKAKL
jgi:ABC-type antimicrobial peptide transport system permease subunit